MIFLIIRKRLIEETQLRLNENIEEIKSELRPQKNQSLKNLNNQLLEKDTERRTKKVKQQI